MTLKPKAKQGELIKQLISQHASMRDFARSINEDASSVLAWREEKILISARAVVSICRYFDILPYELRPDIFPEDVRITFDNK